MKRDIRKQHDRHQIELSRYLAGELSVDERIDFMKTAADCLTCREMLRLHDEIMTGGMSQSALAESESYHNAANTLFRMHRDDVFRSRLMTLPAGKTTPRTWKPAVWRVAMVGAAMVLLAVTVILIRENSVGTHPTLRSVTAQSQANRHATERPQAIPAVPRQERKPVAVTPPLHAENKPHKRTPAREAKPESSGNSLQPVPSNTERQGIVLDSATLVVLTNYLSGNINDSGTLNVDLNHNGAPDAVDLTMILNLSVDNLPVPKQTHHQPDPRKGAI